MRSSHRAGVRLAGGTIGSLLLLASLAAAGAGASTSSLAIVPQGIGAAALSSSAVFGPTPGDTPETVSFILKAQNLDRLQLAVANGMPGGFLSVSQFARQYGQSQSNIAALESYLARYGIGATAYADGLEVAATGTAGQFDSALTVRQNEYRVPAIPAQDGHAARPETEAHGTSQNPLLPRSLAQFVLAIVGLTNYPVFGSNSLRTPALTAGVTPSKLQTGSLKPADFARQYDLKPLYSRGATGAGATIGIVTLASVDPSVPQFFWNNVLGLSTPPGRISLVNIDGGAGPVSDAFDSGETTLDVEQSGALASAANIVVYQAPNSDFGLLDAWFTAASQNVADAVSSSWGLSETLIQASVNEGFESPAYATSFDEAFLELAAQGQSAFDATGDFGAFDASNDLGSTNLAVDNPSDSPWVTAAGGTTLAGRIPLSNTITVRIPAERTWGWDWLWPQYALFGAPTEEAFADAMANGTGGGFSTIEATPAYQELVPSAHRFSAVPYLTPTDFQSAFGLNLPDEWIFNPTPPVTTGFGSGRATPDISTDADPFTGYLEYYTFGDGPAVVEAGWGGTSFVAPQLAGSAALMDSLLGGRVGFWNPAIYQFAAQSNSPFTPLSSESAGNDNLYYTGTAGNVFNVGSGLGTPDLAQLAGDFARNR